MRPVRLELEGFTAFRERVAIDFDGVDLFALVGATGAGKTSVVDGMVFSLYGSVPRLDQRAVEPVISAGCQEARVRFDFTIGDTPYTAVRVVRRQRSGASTKEARLESGDDVLAGDARAVTEAAERVLGLGFEQFTKCVVLPQGEFARFLHDKPRDRQDLLVRLLELGVFERMREAATARHKAALQQAGWLGRQLADLAVATPDALAAAGTRVRELEALRDTLDEAQPRLEALAAAQAEAARQEADAVADAARLGALEVPPDVASLTEQAAAEAEEAAAAEAAHAAAAVALDEAEEALGRLPARGDLVRLRELHARLRTLEERRARGDPIVADARAAAEAAAAELARAEQVVADADTALAAARRAHAAHDLAAHLEIGEPCPVCEQVVAAPPGRAAPPALGRAEHALRRARATHRAAAEAAQAAAERRAKSEQTLTDVVAAIAEAREQVAGQPPADEVARTLDALGRAEADLGAARAAERAARAALRAAAERAATAAQRRDGAWRVFDEARDGVAALGPPATDRSDLAGAWKALAAWAGDEADRRRAAAERAGARRAEAQAAHAALAAELERRCADCGVALAAARPRDACADALAAAVRDRERIAAELERTGELRAAQRTQTEAAAVAETLARHLSARGFERWLLDEALDRLCAGASEILRELSGGQYSLAVDGQHNFAVVDHRNADERRPARTLSGGETFLASLALALTLAEHLRELAVGATPRLESIFLDEGFGTLDPESLDVVATTVEELGAGGRIVGLVTHVRDLAERMPVRFEVRRGASGSTVHRIEA